MRKNLPTIEIETVVPDGVFIYSRTDLKGRITEVNNAFAEISGFEPHEMVGQPHNLIRHPDMPEAAFADMWRCLQSGRPWKGVVKNRRKDGGFYWVVANASPVREAGVVVGYQSVRSRPTSEQIETAKRAYARLSRGDRTLLIRDGRVWRQRPRWVERALTPDVSLFGFALLALANATVGVSALLTKGAIAEVSATILALITVIMAIYVLGVLLPRMRKRLSSVEAFLVSTLSSGELTASLIPTGRDRIGLIAGYVDTLVSAMRATLQIVRDATREVSDSTAMLHGSVERLHAAAAEQSAITSAAATGVEEMTVSIAGVAAHASDTHTIAAQTGAAAGSGVEQSSRAAETIQGLADTIAESTQTVDQLGRRMTEVSRVAGVIKEIAEQTNLLALNAAIEAARAGEQGRGFAVVADEVRKLAERTANATREIDAMIGTIHDGAGQAVAGMVRSKDHVSVAVSLVENAQMSLARINSEMTATVRRVCDISHSSQEQASAMNALSQSVETVARLTEDNLSVADDTQRCSDALQRHVERMYKAVAQYRV